MLLISKKQVDSVWVGELVNESDDQENLDESVRFALSLFFFFFLPNCQKLVVAGTDEILQLFQVEIQK